jgi:predicted Rossmann fold flavoprotein
LAENRYDIVIIGGGAAGLAASIFAARGAKGSCSVAIVEKQQRVGRKLLATGNGTCNLSNSGADLSRYHGNDRGFASGVLEGFPVEKTCEFFASIGVECTEREDGRIYPLCLQAGAVLDCMRLEARSLGVAELVNMQVTGIVCNDGFILDTTGGRLYAKRVLVCTGGAASPSLGGSAESYSLLTSLGHTRTPLFPSIVQVRTDTQYIKSVKGIRVDAVISFELDGRTLASEKGEVLFTDYGLSGPAVMQISRFVSDWERRRQGRMTAVLNLLPDMGQEQIMESLRRRIGMQGRTMGDMLTGLLQNRLGQTVLRSAGYRDFSRPAVSLDEDDLERIAKAITRWETEVTGTQGMGGAQTTAGGIATGEFDPNTMESRIVPGLYAAGELLDIDGDCGGFNLQWAWASAYAASRAIIDSLDR